MQKPQAKSEGAEGIGEYIVFTGTAERVSEMDEFGDFKSLEGYKYHFAGTIDPRFDPKEVVAWLERPKDDGPGKTTTCPSRPDLKAIAKNAPDGTLAILVTVINNNGTDNLLVMLADGFLDRFNFTDRIEVAGDFLHPDWWNKYCGLHNEHQGLAFIPGTGKEVPGFRVAVRNWADVAEIREEIQQAIAWHRPQSHTVEYIEDSNE